MGKGSRNRQLRMSNEVDTPVKLKKQQKKQTPKWVTPLISWLLVAVIVIGIVATAVSNLGLVKRSRVLVESKTGKYDITQQVATFIAWQNAYYNAYYYYQYASIGYIEDDNVTKLYSSADSYALSAAQYSAQETLRNSVEEIKESLVDYVAVCDAAYKAGVTLDSKDKEDIKGTVDWLKSMQTSLSFATFNGFLKGAIDTGMRKADVEKALEIVSLYNKYSQQLEESFEKAVDLKELPKYRDENPDDYYKIDYIGFAAEDKEFAEELKACTDPNTFRELVVKHHFDKNYKTVYNKYTVTVEAANATTAIKSLTDANGGNSLSNKLDELGAGEKTLYTKGSTNLPETVNNWLFGMSRKQYEATSITVEDGIYVIAIYSGEANGNTAEARIKFYEFEDGTSYKADTSFKDAIFMQLLSQRQADNLEEALSHTDADVNTILTDNGAKEMTGVDKNNTEIPEVLRDAVLASSVKAESVVTASEFGVFYVAYVRNVEGGKADVAYCSFGATTLYRSIPEKTEIFHEELKAIDSDKTAEIKAWLDEHDAIEQTAVTSSTPSSKVPSVITKAVTASGVKAGDVLSVSDSYVVYVYGIDAGKAKIAYVEPKADVYYEILNNLISSLDEVYPATKTGSFKSETTKDTLDAWLSEREEGDAFVTSRHEFDTTVIETTTTKDGKDSKTYTAYMVINKPMYLAMDIVYNGGYLKFTDSAASDKEQKPPHATQAAEALKALEGKTGYALRDALQELDSTASTSVSYAESTFTDKNTKAWFMDENRKKDDVAVITSEDGKSSYLVFFQEKLVSWERTAKTNYVSEQMEAKIDELTKDYSINEKYLKKLGELQTTSETTGEETTDEHSH